MQKWRQPALCPCPPQSPTSAHRAEAPGDPQTLRGPLLQPISCSLTLAAAPKASWAALELVVNFARPPCSPRLGLGG